jgi:DNA gyrase/topoisomerase IV subunit B
MSNLESKKGEKNKNKYEEQEYEQLTQLEHVKSEDISMWLGPKKLCSFDMYILDRKTRKFSLQTLCFTPALYKIIDEIIVNSIDHWVNYPNLVTKMIIRFERETGEITIFNDGPGIRIYKIRNKMNEEIYTPQLLASEFYSGNNFKRRERITGGINGVGLKLTNAMSEYLELITADERSKIYYKQHFEDGLERIGYPEVTNFSDRKLKAVRKKGHTIVKFLPNYIGLGYKNGYDREKDGYIIEKIIETRAYQIVAYTGLSVIFNNDKIKFPEVKKKSYSRKKHTSFYQFVRMFILNPLSDNSNGRSDIEDDEDNEEYDSKSNGDDCDNEPKLFHTIIQSQINKEFCTEICVAPSDGKFCQFSLVNGLYPKGGGDHIKYWEEQIVEHLSPKVQREIREVGTKFNKNYILNNIFLFVKSTIPNIDFNSQTKDILACPREFLESYRFSKKDIDDIWFVIRDSVVSYFIGKVEDKGKNSRSCNIFGIDKFTDATAKRKDRPGCTLMICEGYSASRAIREGIVSSKTNLSYKYFGTFDIGGVPMNARKEITIKTDRITGQAKMIRNQRLKNNERLNSLVRVLGLNYDKTYDIETKEGRQEVSSLRYGKIIAATDQDEDGKGNIFGLILNFFILFWPNLVSVGYIDRLNTPIIRAYHNKNIRKDPERATEFYTIPEYHKWIERKFNGDEEQASKTYHIKYYKGLAGHNPKEMPLLLTNLESKLYNYYVDDESNNTMEIYFGKESDARKAELSSNVDESLYPTANEQHISVTNQLKTDTKSYQRDNIIRKLSHVIDGQVPSRRKILYVGREVFKTTKETNKEKCLNKFVGDVRSITNYQHGEASLCNTAILMAQHFPGGCNLPFFIPQGNFGSRSHGIKSAGSPRYISIQLNQALCYQMFPKADDYILPYTFDEGDRCEPKYFCPIIPLAILENRDIPGTGWKCTIWARDVWEVIRNVKNLVRGKIGRARPMNIWQNKINTEIATINNKIYSVGDYYYDEKENQIVVTEVPLGILPEKISGIINVKEDEKKSTKTRKPNKGSMKKSNVSSLLRSQLESPPIDNTNDERVEIIFPLKSDGYRNLIEESISSDTFDPIVRALKLKNTLDDHLNMISENDEVIEFERYENIVDHWFVIRRNLYAMRIDRELIITRIQILYLENIIRFSKKHSSYNINARTKREVCNAKLEEEKYVKFVALLVHNPKFLRNDEIKEKVFDPEKASYDYLLDLRYTDLMEKACKRRQSDLENKKEKLEFLTNDSGQNGTIKGGITWLRELAELEETIRKGLSEGWF